ncbi:hypothetical protein [Planomonospora sp. ID82291]|uniref:hypothetical protein n=1 Tax=Planomonospora sp. ID82291 TaxID=2738136 RepID=UPI0018C39B8C|nr:hypothetical protein [Planomonospora sp. ID82291]MBG0818830.1 hypothetical protein [Planomonospora sp. ID82291]
MTRYTENDLRTVFADYSEDGPARPPHLETIVRRGRRARLRRRTAIGVAAGAVVAAVGVGGALLPGLSGNAADPASGPSTWATISAEPPGTVRGMRGEALSVIHSETHRTMGAPVTVVYRPTSVNTGHSIRCADPKAWVVVQHVGTSGADFGRCGGSKDGPDSQHDQLSVPPGWLDKPQSLKIWVFPADAPIADGPWKDDGTPNPDVPTDDPYAACKKADRKQGTCDGRFIQDVVHARPERLAAVVGRQRGEPWTIKIYDKLAGS